MELLVFLNAGCVVQVLRGERMKRWLVSFPRFGEYLVNGWSKAALVRSNQMAEGGLESFTYYALWDLIWDIKVIGNVGGSLFLKFQSSSMFSPNHILQRSSSSPSYWKSSAIAIRTCRAMKHLFYRQRLGNRVRLLLHLLLVLLFHRHSAGTKNSMYSGILFLGKIRYFRLKRLQKYWNFPAKSWVHTDFN